MALTKIQGKSLIEKKINDFKSNENLYINKTFQETETRNRFIDPFFQALGWEFDQTEIHRQLWDVHREYSQKDNSSTKKPDYAFRVEKKVKFFVEAKAPWVTLTDKDPVFQAKRYAFSTNGKAPIVIITDFQEFRVFNALERPIYNNPLQGLLKEFDLKYTDYLDNWENIYSEFSKESVLAGSLDKLAGKITKSTKTLDKEFLEDIIKWRELLAKNIAIRNKKLDLDALNESVQRILDRLIFIRNLEDRQIEEEGLLYKISQEKEEAYKHLIPIFRRLDADYNGLLFKKHFSEDVSIDDKTFKDIIQDMCYPNSPFQFDVIEPEILGRIYEKFLGSKIRLTENHQAKIEEKPEVRHSGGVFYTPQYIVDYIVENTVGQKLKNLSPEKIENIKILDPACGSGSFLLGAFSSIVEYHQKWYQENRSTKKYKKDFFINEEGEIRLTLEKKSQILRNNIFGVDIDREATEVAIMSLYLKMLEDGYEKNKTYLFLNRHILPDMIDNIKCGNSLINREQVFNLKLFENENLHAFDWKDEENGFGKIFKNNGGFDCVVSNPPYIKTQALQSFYPTATEIYKKSYKSADEGNFDIYIIFIEKALELLAKDGLVGYICPHTFFNAKFGGNIRKIIAEKKNIKRIIHFGSNFIFDNPATTCLLFLSEKQSKEFDYFQVRTLKENINEAYLNNIKFYQVDAKKIVNEAWVFLNNDEEKFFAKVKENKPLLGDITTNIFQGPKAGADPVFIFKLIEEKPNKYKGYSTSLEKEFLIEKDLVKPYVKGKRIEQYRIVRNDEYVIFPYESDGTLITESTLEKKYPLTYKYLSEKENKEILLEREEGRFKKIWWSYSRPQNMTILDKKKILTPFNAYENSFAYDKDGDFIFSAGVSGAYGILLKENTGIDYFYLLGLLNSKLLERYLRFISIDINNGYFSYENKYIKQLPIFIPDKNDKTKMQLMKQIGEIVPQIQEMRIDNKRQDDADFLIKKIDEIVNQLYDM